MNKGLLLDTHIFLWLMFKDKNLSKSELKLIEQYAKKNSLFISAISIWEIALLAKRGRINLYQPPLKWVEEALALPGISLAPLTPAILCESVDLPEEFHKDPADRMIVATARMMKLRLMTHDQKILDYAEQGLIE
jgi:PIN domain nuclease of toxin-antitoxin system